MWIIPATLLLAALPVDTGLPADVSVRALDNSSLQGRLLELSSEAIVLEIDGRKETLSLEEQIGLAPLSPPENGEENPRAWLQLTDGSQLVAEGYLVSGGRVESPLSGGGTLSAGTAAVQWVRFKRQTPQQAEEWAKVVRADVQADLIVIRRNEQIDYLEGIVEDVTAETINFRLDGELVPVRRERVEGLVYYHPRPARSSPPLGVVTDAAGSTLQAVSLAYDAAGLRIETAGGLAVVRPLEAIRQIDFSVGKIEYLSALEPQSVTWTPFFGTAADDPHLAALYRPRMDRAITSESARGEDALLQLRSTTEQGVPEIRSYERGIALHSRTEISWALPDEFRSFKALAGIDARYRNIGHVELVVRGDGRELFRGYVAGSDEPLSLDLDISGVRRLTILVDYGENLDLGDHLNLCNARIIK